MELTSILIFLLIISVSINIITIINWKIAEDLIKILEADASQDYMLLLEYQKQITKLNKEKEEKKKSKKKLK